MRLGPGYRDSFAETSDADTLDESFESRMNDVNSLNPLNPLSESNEMNQANESNPSTNPLNESGSLSPLNESNPLNSLNESNSSVSSSVNSLNPLSESNPSTTPLNESTPLNSLNESTPLIDSNPSHSLNSEDESNASMKPLIDSNRSIGSVPSPMSLSVDPDKQTRATDTSELKDSMSSLDVSGRSDILQRVGAIPQNGMDGREALSGSLNEVDLREENEEELSETKLDSLSSDESDSSRNTLQSPSEERDRRVETLKIEIEELKKSHENQLNLLRAQMDQLLVRYMAIEQSLCGV